MISIWFDPTVPIKIIYVDDDDDDDFPFFVSSKKSKIIYNHEECYLIKLQEFQAAGLSPTRACLFFFF